MRSFLCGLYYALRNIRSLSCGLYYALRIMRSLLCSLYYALRNIRSLSCGFYYALRIMRSLLCGLYYAHCNIRSSTRFSMRIIIFANIYAVKRAHFYCRGCCWRRVPYNSCMHSAAQCCTIEKQIVGDRFWLYYRRENAYRVNVSQH